MQSLLGAPRDTTMTFAGVPKETAEGETRVALTPYDVDELVEKGFKVYVEMAAGLRAGFSVLFFLLFTRLLAQ